MTSRTQIVVQARLAAIASLVWGLLGVHVAVHESAAWGVAYVWAAGCAGWVSRCLFDRAARMSGWRCACGRVTVTYRGPAAENADHGAQRCQPLRESV